MKYYNVTPAQIGRKANRTVALALALALGGGVATTAMAGPGGVAQTQHTSAAEQQAQQALAVHQAQRAADAARASAQPTGITRDVTNCNNSGAGSLRDAVANAHTGDTIDMTTMLCYPINLDGSNHIHLNTAIEVDVDDLTLVGKLISDGPFSFYKHPGTYIHGNPRAIYHNAVGTLTLKNIDVSDGHNTSGLSGGCIFSFGNVTLSSSYVHDCVTKRQGATHDVEGGAIYAKGKVTLSGGLFVGSRVYDNVASAGDSDAYGGGIYAGGPVDIGTRSSVYGNLAESTEGNAYGGGIYGKSFVDLTESSSVVRDNTAKTHAKLTHIDGAGIFTEKSSFIHGSVTDNQAIPLSSGAVYRGAGVGIFAELGVKGYEGSSFSDNNGSRSRGGAIYTNGFLELEGSTVADNTGVRSGAIFAKGDVTIKSSTISGNRSRDTANMELGPDASDAIRIESSTISNNNITGSSENGAALNLQSNAYIYNSTITGNVEKNDTDTKYGAGISLDSNVNVGLVSTIVGDNFLEDANGDTSRSDVFERKDASGASITGYNSMVAVTFMSTPSDMIRASPQLGSLADNGGPTKTHEPCRFSMAISNGATYGHTYDQRGPGFPRVVGAEADIGAIEQASNFDDILFRNGFEKGACRYW